MSMSNAEAFQRVVNAELAEGDGIELQIYFDQPGFSGPEEVLLHEGDSVEALNDELVYFHSEDDANRLLPMRLFIIMNVCRDEQEDEVSATEQGGILS